VNRETLTQLVGRDCSIDLLIDDIRDEMRNRPYELVSVAGGWQHRTRIRFADAIRSVTSVEQEGRALSQADLLVSAIVAYPQPITRREISNIIGEEVSRDTIAHIRSLGFVSSGPRSPQPGAPYTLVTTRTFLSSFGLETLRDLPNVELLEDAGLLSRERMFDGDIPIASDEQDEQADFDDESQDHQGMQR
jgi:segregation and condensation protein B